MRTHSSSATIIAKPGSHISNRDACMIYEWTRALGVSLGGEVTDRETNLIYDGIKRDKSSPFRKHMDWNDRTAARKWRLHQIRNILGIILVEVVDATGEKIQTRAFRNIPFEKEDASGDVERGRKWVNLPELDEDRDSLYLLFEDHLKRLRYWREEAQKIDPEGGIFGRFIEAINNGFQDAERKIHGLRGTPEDREIAAFIKEAEEAIIKSNSEAKKGTTLFKSCLLLLLATRVGTDVKTLVRHTKYDEAFIRGVKKRLMAANIWDEKRPKPRHGWVIKQLVLDGFWEDVAVAEDLV